MIIKAWNQKDSFTGRGHRGSFHLAAVLEMYNDSSMFLLRRKKQPTKPKKPKTKNHKVLYHWIFSTEFASFCKLIFLQLRKMKKKKSYVNRHIIYVEVFSSVALWYFDVVRSEGNFVSDCKKLHLNYFILWRAHQTGVNVCIQSIQCLITFNNIQNSRCSLLLDSLSGQLTSKCQASELFLN